MMNFWRQITRDTYLRCLPPQSQYQEATQSSLEQNTKIYICSFSPLFSLHPSVYSLGLPLSPHIQPGEGEPEKG